jgi:hypothetical protein
MESGKDSHRRGS